MNISIIITIFTFINIIFVNLFCDLHTKIDSTIGLQINKNYFSCFMLVPFFFICLYTCIFCYYYCKFKDRFRLLNQIKCRLDWRRCCVVYIRHGGTKNGPICNRIFHFSCQTDGMYLLLVSMVNSIYWGLAWSHHWKKAQKSGPKLCKTSPNRNIFIVVSRQSVVFNNII